MWTEQSIATFIKQHPIRTDGALSPYEVTIREKDDGDEFTEVTLLFWHQNRSVVRDVLAFLTDAIEDNDTSIYLRDNMVIVDLFTRVCDPD